MAANLAKWPSNRGLISKIRPSDGCKGNTVPSRWYGGISANLEVFWVMSAQISNSQDDLDLSWRGAAMTSLNAFHSVMMT